MKPFLKRSFIFALGLVASCQIAYATGKVLPAITNQSATVVGGSDPSSNITPLSVDGSGYLNVNAVVTPLTPVSPFNFNTTITLAGAANRTQLASNVATSCIIQAFSTNVGAVYLGGSTVTNASGANEGIKINLGQYGPSLSVSNSNLIYVAADNANDKVKAICN